MQKHQWFDADVAPSTSNFSENESPAQVISCKLWESCHPATLLT